MGIYLDRLSRICFKRRVDIAAGHIGHRDRMKRLLRPLRVQCNISGHGIVKVEQGAVLIVRIPAVERVTVTDRFRFGDRRIFFDDRLDLV